MIGCIPLLPGAQNRIVHAACGAPLEGKSGNDVSNIGSLLSPLLLYSCASAYRETYLHSFFCGLIVAFPFHSSWPSASCAVLSPHMHVGLAYNGVFDPIFFCF
ncbi:hypothetical protein, unlikely [Trypanosoma brucei gambiense DAL972]|uniref:Uncharacterized protein n=1 Tax=Trypanosoma brucei gambiense (strain MHOM/CI/86/DAL972) TaxID=679716 RepID=D0A3U7_TRYB9|nr:hypothetical protein, unlikely [Trypanosoma brucei gambiense DAL972]CBH15941.1 hypothetical protein, unlikely [Trypanosoma brucei gambiense DAL972]|eukprot:XP_011778205.1 hypothetical protein, unlikely [Trypanosoma brucei gambiense DAL972]